MPWRCNGSEKARQTAIPPRWNIWLTCTVTANWASAKTRNWRKAGRKKPTPCWKRKKRRKPFSPCRKAVPPHRPPRPARQTDRQKKKPPGRPTNTTKTGSNKSRNTGRQHHGFQSAGGRKPSAISTGSGTRIPGFFLPQRQKKAGGYIRKNAPPRPGRGKNRYHHMCPLAKDVLKPDIPANSYPQKTRWPI